MANVFVGAPVRNRAWIMERHLQPLKQQTVNKQFFYILNDSEDQTVQILNDHQIPYLTDNEENTDAVHSDLRAES
ncbi:hypothetical protein [Paenibacillus sp. BIC5C1]|uniref:hypothetical protein n=1 Tax=Paenibacillus sp. BIC5C1 TaxID=3078263 RepID=UPI0028E84AA6|nr:hypothetical protein [Paenibacillus sp. BIC5C1]